MSKKLRFLNKIFSSLMAFLLVFQSLSIYVLAQPQKVYAQDVQEEIIDQTNISTPVDEEVGENTLTQTEDPNIPTIPNLPNEEISVQPELNEPTEPDLQNPENNSNVTTPESNSNSELQPDPLPEPTPQLPVEMETEKECLTDQSIRDSVSEDWSVNNEEASAVAKVSLGIKYIFPLENKVTITFKCLPKNVDSSLTIKKIKISDLKLPEGTNPYGEYAYDITTGMEDGTFEYDITLPKPEESSVEVSYMEDPVGELKNVEDSKISQNGDVAKIENVDHLTIWIVSATMGITGLIDGQSHLTVSPNEIVTAELNVGTSGTGDSDNWVYSSYRFNGTGTWHDVDTADHLGDGSYTESFELTAPASAGTYDVNFRACNYPSCTGGPGSKSWTYTLDDGLTVVGGYTPTKICHSTGSEENPYVSQTPSTLGKLMGHVGDGHQDGEDIIPPITTVLPLGQNWDSDGQTIYRNDCSTVPPTGTLRVLKNVDINGDGDYGEAGETGNTSWQWQAVGPQTVSGNTGDSAITVSSGDYVLSETAQTNFHFYKLTCTGGTLVGSTITVGRGATVVCTFENLRNTGNLRVQKVVDDGSDLSQWSFGLDGRPAIAANAQGVVDFGQVTTADVHTIVEFGPDNYFLESITGANCSASLVAGVANATVNYGGTTICTFNNDITKGSITIIKDASPHNSQDFSFITSGTGLSNFLLDDDSNPPLSNTKIFSGLFPGTYTVSEVPVPGWQSPTYTCSSDKQTLKGISISGLATINLSAGENVTCTFYNFKNGSIAGYKWNDDNGNGIRDGYSHYGHWHFTESTLSNWSIFLDDGDGIYEPGEIKDDTDGSGNYSFGNLASGTYRVCEIEKTSEGWHNTSGGVCRNDVVVGNGQNVTDINFGNQQRGSIKVCKVTIDAGGKITNGSEMPATTFRINWSGGDSIGPTIINSGYSFNDQVFSSSEGDDAYCVEYTGIHLANYHYYPEAISTSGWETPKYNDQYRTDVMDLGDFYYYGVGEDANGYIDLNNDAGPNRTIVILNQYKVGSVTVTKFEDLNQDGIWNNEEPTLDGWDITLGKQTQTTENGQTVFENVVQDTYSLSELIKEGWVQTNIYCGEKGEPRIDHDNQYDVYVGAGQNTDCYIGNYELLPKLTITKTNDKPSGVGQSEVITYTLTIENTGNVNLENVTVNDVPPGGFTYVAGSTLIDGVASADPGIAGGVLSWVIPSMAAGQKMVIAYKLLTPNDLTAGIYTNYADCDGGVMTVMDGRFKIVVEGEKVTCDPASVTSLVFEGQSSNYGGSLTPLVLGASTEVLGATLPATGSSTTLLILAITALALGLLLNYKKLGVKSKKSVSKKKGKKNAKK